MLLDLLLTLPQLCLAALQLRNLIPPKLRQSRRPASGATEADSTRIHRRPKRPAGPQHQRSRALDVFPHLNQGAPEASKRIGLLAVEDGEERGFEFWEGVQWVDAWPKSKQPVDVTAVEMAEGYSNSGGEVNEDGITPDTLEDEHVPALLRTLIDNFSLSNGDTPFDPSSDGPMSSRFSSVLGGKHLSATLDAALKVKRGLSVTEEDVPANEGAAGAPAPLAEEKEEEAAPSTAPSSPSMSRATRVMAMSRSQSTKDISTDTNLTRPRSSTRGSVRPNGRPSIWASTRRASIALSRPASPITTSSMSRKNAAINQDVLAAKDVRLPGNILAAGTCADGVVTSVVLGLLWSSTESEVNPTFPLTIPCSSKTLSQISFLVVILAAHHVFPVFLLSRFFPCLIIVSFDAIHSRCVISIPLPSFLGAAPPDSPQGCHQGTLLHYCACERYISLFSGAWNAVCRWRARLEWFCPVLGQRPPAHGMPCPCGGCGFSWCLPSLNPPYLPAPMCLMPLSRRSKTGTWFNS